MTCRIELCDRPILARDLCGTHYARWRKHGTAEKTASNSIPETLREIPNFKGYYCNIQGEVFTTRRKGRHLEERGPLLQMKPRKRRDGYLQCHFRVAGLEHAPLVHQVVLTTWQSVEQSLVANHKNGIKSENRLENLEWVTQKENIRHAIDVLKRDFRRKPQARQ